jgi:DNA-binding transcriptional LysR family regulator
MDTLEAMRVFVAVAERNGFSTAAEALNLSTASVTRLVAALERRLHTRLLNRTTRRVGLTTAGTAYYQRCVQLLAELDDMEAGLSAQALQPSGLLRINAPVSYGIAKLGPLLADFHANHPQVQLELSLSDRLVDMVEEGYDVALRITRQPAPNLIARLLAPVQVVLCAAPAYLQKAGTPRLPADLADHQCLGYSYWASGDQWPLHGADGEHLVRISGCLRANNGDVLREAALAGMGIILQPDFLLETDLATGRLQRLLVDYQAPAIGLYAVYSSRSHLAPKLRSFIDYMVQALAQDDASAPAAG